MEKDRDAARTKYRANLAWLFCVDDYSVLESANDKERKEIIARARKMRKIKSGPASSPAHGGNPYVMLGRKINNKGKIVK